METGQIDQLGKVSVSQIIRTFKVQWEVAAMRVEDNTEKKEYELLNDQRSSYRQKKVVKEERTQKA